ncbi:MAG TPA: M56 family metallopeptidase [Verrucomicrobiae bacterium]|nr:M56 family metallopeptidase [Verrucomicrobiae bacterium]
MIHLAQWISPDLLRPLGLALLHFLWQGAALAALAALALTVARTASTRYLFCVVILAAMVAAPVVTFLILRNQPPQPLAISAASPVGAPGTPRHSAIRANGNPEQPQPASEKSYLFLVEAWFFGVLLLSLRTAGGVVALERLRRRNSAPLSAALRERCLALQRQMGLARFIQYCESFHLDAPSVIGWIRPVVLLPLSALTGLSEAQLTAVIAHELAHIRRYDAFVNLFQIAVESVLFYHPAVWWLSKRIRAERENCCDDAAIAVCGSPLEYARALTLMEEWRVMPALAMAANRAPLADRIRRLLGVPAHSSSVRTANLTAGVLCLSVALVAGNAFLGIARASVSPGPRPVPQAAAAAARDLVIVVRGEKPAPDPQPGALANPQPQPQPAPQSSLQTETHESYIDALKAAGYDNLSADDLISMKVQGVTPAYIRAIQAAGLKPTADELIGMKVQGVTPEYIQELRAAGLKLDVDELIGMKVQGVTPDYLRQMKDLGLQTGADNLIGMKVQGVTPDYVREIRAAGVKCDTDELIGMKVQGITPGYVNEIKDLGIQADADGLIGMKVQGITPVYIRALQAEGLKPTADEFIGMKVQGVTPEYVRTLQAAGLKLNPDDLISAKVAGITPEFIREAQSHGFKNLDLEKLIELKHTGVLEK